MNDFKNVARNIWKEMRSDTPFESPPPDTGEYKADFYGSKIGEGVKFPQLVRFLHDTVVDSSLLFNWTAFAAPSSYTSYTVRDGEGGFIPRINIIDHNVPFVYINANNQKVETAIAARLNKRIDYLEEGWAFMLHLDAAKKYLAGSICFYYENTEKYRNNASDTIDLNDFRIAEKYIAVSLTSEDFTDFCALVEAIGGKREANFVRQQIAKKYVQKILGATSASELKFLYETIPDFAFEWIRPYLEFKLVLEHLSILKSYDDTGYFSAFRDSSGAMINLLRVLGDSRLVYHLFLNNPLLVKELYQNMDGVSTIGGKTQKNRMIFADFLYALSLSNQYQGATKTGAVFKIGANYELNSNVLAGTDKFKDKIYLQQLTGEKEKKTLTPLEDIPRYKEQIEVDVTTYTAEDDGAYYDPLAAVLLMNVDEREGTPYQVPAIYVKAIADEKEWQDITLALRIGGNALAIVLGIATLGSGSPFLVALGLIDISLATTDTLIAISQDPLMQTEEGREFLANWEKIYLAGSIVAVGPLIVSGAFTTGVKLLNKAINTTTKNFLRSSLLRLVMELNIPNFTKHTLTVLASGEEVSRTTSTVIRMSEASRLQEAGVLFVKGELVGGKTGKVGLVVIYKGEVLASGEAKAVRNSLDEVWSAKGVDLIKALEARSGLKQIDEAIDRLGIAVTVPKNTLSFAASHKRLQSIIRSLERKRPSKVFDPNKNALKALGIKLKKSKVGLSVDFADTPYLYPVTGEQKNIVKIKLTGTRRFDDKLAYELAGIKIDVSILDNYTWHHLDDFDPIFGTCTIQLVESKVHVACYPHYGAVSLIENFYKIKYK